MSKDAHHITQQAGARKTAPATKGKRDLVSNIVAALIILAGVALLMYPHVSNWLSELARKQVMNTQTVTVQQAPKEDLSKYLKQAREYNKRLYSGQPNASDPFGANAYVEGTKEYRKLLNLTGDGVMGSIHIPKVSINNPIYHGVSDKVLEEGAGHLPSSSLPVGGKNTHSVITGHTGLPSAKFFDDIDQLVVGDWFVIEVLGKSFAYRVYDIDVVLPEEVGSLTIQPGKDLVTLVTCTPYGVNTHRLLVHAERTKVPQEWKDIKAAEPNPPTAFVTPNPLWPWALGGLGIAIALLLIVFAIRRAVKAAKKDKEPSGAAESGDADGGKETSDERSDNS